MYGVYGLLGTLKNSEPVGIHGVRTSNRGNMDHCLRKGQIKMRSGEDVIICPMHRLLPLHYCKYWDLHD